MITCTHITKKYGSHTALTDVTVKFKKHTSYGVVGLNGAGKTTLLNCIVGACIYSGTITKSSSTRIGYQPQHAALDEHATVTQQLLFFAELQHLPEKRVTEVLKQCEIGFGHKRISELSNGMRRRVEIAQALLNNPNVLLLDEPTAGLDPAAVASLRTLIASLRASLTLILTSHNLEDIEELCDELVVLEEGTLKHVRSLTKRSPATQIRIRLNKKPAQTDLSQLKQLAHVESVETHGRVVLIHVQSEKYIKGVLKKVVGTGMEIGQIQVGDAIDELFA